MRTQLVGAIRDAVLAGAEAALREAGMCVPPTAHFLVEQLEQPYVGYVRCRPFYRGNDVVLAMANMGLAASVLGATRLVVAWEHQDLSVALRLPEAETFATGQVFLDVARHGGHETSWYPYDMEFGPLTSGGWPTVTPLWSRPAVLPDAHLPHPVGALLAVWREPRTWTDRELIGTVERLEDSGYHLGWVARPVGEQDQPRGVALLAPSM